MSHHSHLKIYKITNKWHYGVMETTVRLPWWYTILTKTVKETWKLLLINRMNIIPACKTHDVPITWFIGILPLFCYLLIYDVACSYFFCAIQRPPAHLRVQLKSAGYELSKTTDRTWHFVFLRWKTFYFVSSYENNDRIMTLTYSLTPSHLTADTESGQRGFFSNLKRNDVACLFILRFI